jgi:Fungal chitosanase of glycosyl hydrolase group 75
MKSLTLILIVALISVSRAVVLTPLKSFGTTTVYRTQNTVNCAKGKLGIDADGSPHAYHPNGSPPGLDYLANAGKPGNWYGIVTDNQKASGNPVVQGSSDPAPGFYISSTAL